MIQDINPHKLDMTYTRRAALDSDFVIVTKGSKILLRDSDNDGDPGDKGDGTLPRLSELAPLLPGLRGGSRDNLVSLFAVDADGLHLYTGEVPEGEAPPGFAFKDQIVLRSFQPSWLGFAAVTACHLGGWYAANRFCGSCGARMEEKGDERAMRCPACGNIVYPRISPAVIVGVTDGDRILMTRYANRPNNTAMTALVAGFMEIGETLEDTVAREVGEEVGLKVKNIRYYKSQPWAFSGSVLVGFYTDVDGSTEITVDEVELQEAAWVARADLPANQSLASLTATMVDAFRRNDFPLTPTATPRPPANSAR